MPETRSLYLISYNLFQALGWSLSLFRILSGLLSSQSIHGAYAAAGELICWLQTLAFLEVIHGAIGDLKNHKFCLFGFRGTEVNFCVYNFWFWMLRNCSEWRGASSDAMGWRTHFLLAIVRRIQEVQNLPSVFVTFFAWSLSEVIRYSHYVLNLSGSNPKWITLIRYTAFIFLYPIGVFPGEMWLMYKALPVIKKKKLYADHLPFSYYNFVVLLLFCYPFMWLKLYLHLFKQRRSKLGKSKRKKN
ncbi:very-long-chain (3R)-3-hydroxyacyl-CoA dehydratase 2 [Dorcoceras hygrometricum]|uniref:Very-long-chain (3R)-3-hydroxyacyl-CoA dehydratase n=1 Tax=Dorcoceras hygrometricum TaxID=472368 RepID=A0A2Z7C050_9LAMI|nr:very-long-chain (3R)-3-hydroxyacyl-CoA dehydratase 2 [Dorcoceras hygrometricum]